MFAILAMHIAKLYRVSYIHAATQQEMMRIFFEVLLNLRKYVRNISIFYSTIVHGVDFSSEDICFIVLKIRNVYVRVCVIA